MQGSRHKMRVRDLQEIMRRECADHNIVYKYFASSWLFHPGHFAARLAEEKYYDRLEDRSPHWTYFVKEWVPRNYPGYTMASDRLPSFETNHATTSHKFSELQPWYKSTRATVREKVFTMFPHVATEYYTKRAAYVKDLAEHRIRAHITAAIPTGDCGWKDDFLQPHIIVKQPSANPSTPDINPTAAGELTPPLTPIEHIADKELNLSDFILPSPTTPHPTEQSSIPLYLDPLPRTPPLPFTPHPPAANMSSKARLLCLARWTLFDPINGTPYLLSSPRDKDFEMSWTDATYLGATEKMLVEWVEEMWWHIWIRQSHTNYVGMWKKRFEKEDRKKERMKEEEEAKQKAEELVKANKEKIMGRLKALNVSLGLDE